MAQTRALALGSVEGAPDELALLWRCVDCGACARRCEIGQDPPAILARARSLLSVVAPGPMEEMEGRVAAVTVDRGPQGVADEGSERGLLLWPGCRSPATAEPVAQLASSMIEAASGRRPRRLQGLGLGCCAPRRGDPIPEGQAEGRLDALARILGSTERVVVLDPTCAQALSAEVGGGARPVVSSASTFLLEHLGRLGRLLDSARSMAGRSLPRVAIHEGCGGSAGRLRAEALATLVERASGRPALRLVAHGVDSDCCGARPGFEALWPADAAAMARSITAEAASMGGDLLVTESPHCAQHLGRFSGLPVRSLVGFLASSLRFEGTA
jgi:Fe-S oxidoreductase